MKSREVRRQQFGQRVRFYRQLHGWYLDALAERIGTTRTSMSRIEGGKQNLSIDDMIALAEVLEVPLSVLVADDADDDVVTIPLREHREMLQRAKEAQSALDALARLLQGLEELREGEARHCSQNAWPGPSFHLAYAD